MLSTMIDGVSIEEARIIIGVSKSTVVRYIETGVLPAERDGNTWLMKREDVEELADPIKRYLKKRR